MNFECKNIIYVLTATNRDKINKLLPLLSQKRQNLKNIAGSLGELLIRIVACENLKTENNTLVFAEKENHKPFLKNYPQFHFNMSHCENIVTVAFSDDFVGVDIEKIRPVNLKIAERFFSSEEKLLVKDNLSFFTLWTKKEAFIKRSGNGLKTPLNSFNVLKENNIKTFIEDNIIISLCSNNPESFRLLWLDENDVLNAASKLNINKI